jgi:hypothetical protein
MSYDLHIVRGEDTLGNPAHRITVEEWVAYVESDAELRFTEEGKPFYSPHLALLPQGPEDPEGWPWLSWSSGKIYAKYPQEPTVRKMLSIAAHFGGYVTGDEGETYSLDENGKIAVKPY